MFMAKPERVLKYQCTEKVWRRVKGISIHLERALCTAAVVEIILGSYCFQ